MKISNIFKHFHTINKHRWKVFKLSIIAGIPYRGLMHDLSKYSFSEFWEGVEFYQGDRSPIIACKRKNGYSKAWLHHKGRNKHHPEYWLDPDRNLDIQKIVMPYKYVAEMVCDTLAAGIVYSGKSWTNKTQLEYWINHSKDNSVLNNDLKDFLTEVYTEISKKGIKPVIKKKNLKKLYNKYIK